MTTRRWSGFAIATTVAAAIALGGCSASPTSTPSGRDRQADLPRTVIADSALVRPYALGLDEFAANDFVSLAVEGTVVDARTVVIPEDEGSPTVGTVMTVKVEASSSKEQVGRELGVYESGGLVKVGQVRSEIELNIGRKLTDAELDQPIDYRDENQPHTEAGDKVLFLLASKMKGEDLPTDFGVVARLKWIDGEYHWYGAPFNPTWPKTVSSSAADRLLLAAGR